MRGTLSTSFSLTLRTHIAESKSFASDREETQRVPGTPNFPRKVCYPKICAPEMPGIELEIVLKVTDGVNRHSYIPIHDCMMLLQSPYFSQLFTPFCPVFRAGALSHV